MRMQLLPTPWRAVHTVGYTLGIFNIQGTHKVFDIKTGKVKKTRTVQQLPMPDSFIAAVNNWGLRSKRDRSARKLEFRLG
jgi:hypothetical protein